jgi:hypothetical protein
MRQGTGTNTVREWVGSPAVRELQRRSEEIGDRLVRKYGGRVRIEQQRRTIDRETDAEIRAAIEEMTR